MKQLIFLVSALILISSCQQEEPETCTDGHKNQNESDTDCGGVCPVCNISYPDNGFYGHNILDDTTTHFSVSTAYSMTASVPAGSSIRVKIQLTGSSFTGMDLWFYSMGSDNNLMITTYNETNGQQEFQSNGGGNIELNMSFSGTSTATIEIYENGATTPTRTKNITWS